MDRDLRGTPPLASKAALTTLEAMYYLGLSRKHWERLARAGDVKAMQRDGVWLINRRAAERYLAIPEGWVALREAVPRLTISRLWAERMAREGLLEAKKHRGIWIISEAAIETYRAHSRANAVPFSTLGSEELRNRLTSFRLDLRTNGFSAPTIRSYAYVVSLFGRYCEAHGADVVTVARDALEPWIGSRYELSRSSGANATLSLRAFYRWAIRAGLRSDDPTEGIKVSRSKPQPRIPFSDNELRALLQATRSPRDRAQLLVLINTGVRRAELVGMNVADVDWERGVIHVRRAKADKPRLVGVSDDTLQALREYVGDRDSGPLFTSTQGKRTGKRQGDAAVYHWIKRLAARAGVANAYVHRLRVSMANRWLDLGNDLVGLQIALGHSQISQTAHYARYNSAARSLEAQRTMLAGIVDDRP